VGYSSNSDVGYSSNSDVSTNCRAGNVGYSSNIDVGYSSNSDVGTDNKLLRAMLSGGEKSNYTNEQLQFCFNHLNREISVHYI
jgi:hypothetical protein